MIDCCSYAHFIKSFDNWRILNWNKDLYRILNSEQRRSTCGSRGTANSKKIFAYEFWECWYYIAGIILRPCQPASLRIANTYAAKQMPVSLLNIKSRPANWKKTMNSATEIFECKINDAKILAHVFLQRVSWALLLLKREIIETAHCNASVNDLNSIQFCSETYPAFITLVAPFICSFSCIFTSLLVFMFATGLRCLKSIKYDDDDDFLIRNILTN
jgi:hypothetical protein